MFEDLASDLADDEDEDEVLDDDERVLQEVQQGVRLEDEKSSVEAVTASKNTCEIMFISLSPLHVSSRQRTRVARYKLMWVYVCATLNFRINFE